ncbi:hypothetical protein [Kitasatospora sp. NPDC089509]|uniref:hypothetical protein n=1 Tax=Kitasatospora sp. NPDC089509 TaxID=3364079 RepID=UPI0038116667
MARSEVDKTAKILADGQVSIISISLGPAASPMELSPPRPQADDSMNQPAA